MSRWLRMPTASQGFRTHWDCLQEAIWFTLLDLKRGYWQVELAEASKALTAFTVDPLRFCECEHMLFGLTDTLATFQHLMGTCLGNLHFQWCIIYFYGIIVFVATPKDHLTRLHAVLLWLQEVGLNLQPTKCDFFKTSVVYLGHGISKEGI